VDILVWTIARDGRLAQVGEDGELSGDPELVALLQERMGETITVFRHGTVREVDGAPRVPIELRPGDRRYVVARVRTLCESGEGWEVTACDWRQPDPAG
jgi:hypothetical protein